jgi:hypothetical protein
MYQIMFCCLHFRQQVSVKQQSTCMSEAVRDVYNSSVSGGNNNEGYYHLEFKIEVTSSSEISATFYQTAWRHFAQDSNITCDVCL